MYCSTGKHIFRPQVDHRAGQDTSGSEFGVGAESGTHRVKLLDLSHFSVVHNSFYCSFPVICYAVFHVFIFVILFQMCERNFRLSSVTVRHLQVLNQSQIARRRVTMTCR